MNFFKDVKDGVIACSLTLFMTIYILFTALVTTLIVMSPFLFVAWLLK